MEASVANGIPVGKSMPMRTARSNVSSMTTGLPWFVKDRYGTRQEVTYHELRYVQGLAKRGRRTE